jgi:hypothetical protein
VPVQLVYVKGRKVCVVGLLLCAFGALYEGIAQLVVCCWLQACIVRVHSLHCILFWHVLVAVAAANNPTGRVVG